jgi:hypothetical protein
MALGIFANLWMFGYGSKCETCSKLANEKDLAKAQERSSLTVDRVFKHQ